MTTEQESAEAELKLPALKLVEPEIDPNDIWDDDRLEREKIATRLTTIVKDQEAPFVISLDGRWGTGKTFLLKRWQQELVNDRYQAIYFNAWEDDFCDDPLLAIIGQLTEHFQEGMLREMAAIIGDIALPILAGKLTGVAFTRKDLKRDNLLNDYRTQLRTKREIRNHLARLAEVVKEQSEKPLVFIIDELDRCRPTFAIELLERVKHIFDVPNIVFVFGINRGELVKSLASIYGEIDAGVYLRRFFDMEFTLPDAEPQAFCKYLVHRYGLDSFFDEVGKSQNNRFYSEEFEVLSDALPVIVGQMSLSLRDMDYCIRMVALISRGLQIGNTVFPRVLAFLIAIKICSPNLYRRFVQGSAHPAELVNFMNDRRVSAGAQQPKPESRERMYLDYVEGAIYCTGDGSIVREQLEQMGRGVPPKRPELIADATMKLNATVKSDADRLRNLKLAIDRFDGGRPDYKISAPYLAELIDLHVRDSVR